MDTETLLGFFLGFSLGAMLVALVAYAVSLVDGSNEE